MRAAKSKHGPPVATTGKPAAPAGQTPGAARAGKPTAPAGQTQTASPAGQTQTAAPAGQTHGAAPAGETQTTARAGQTHGAAQACQAPGPDLAVDDNEHQRGWLIAAVAALAVAAAAATFTEVHNYDIFWHLASGNWMLAHGRVLAADPFSIDPLPQWVNVHWLFQVIVSSLYAVGGFAALVGLKTILAAATVIILAVACRRDAPPAWIILAGLLALAAIETRLAVRPESFTLLFMMATIALVESVRRGASARRLWLLPAVMLPWVNMHGLYFLGPALFWSAAAGAALDRRLGRDFFGNIGNLPTRGAVLAMLAASAACLITPWPLQAAAQPLLLWTRISGQTKAYTYGVLEFIPTWQSGFFLVVAVALLVPATIACAVNFRRVPIAHWLWLAAIGAVAVMARRNVALTGPVCGYLLTVHGGQVIRRIITALQASNARIFGDRHRRGQQSRRAGASESVPIFALPAANIAAILLALVVAALCANELVFRLTGFHRRFGPGLYRPYYPIDIASHLGTLKVRGDILCDNWGDAGTFINFSRPRRLWMDGRLEAHTLERFKSQGRISRELRKPASASTVELPPEVRFIFVRGEAREALTAMARSQRYRLIRVDETGVCFERTDYPGRAGDELPEGDNLGDFDRPLTSPGEIAGLPANVRRWWRQNPPSRYYPIGAEMLWLAWRPPNTPDDPDDRLRRTAGLLAVRYLEAALAEGLHDRTVTLGMLAQAYQQRALLEDVTPGEAEPIDFCSARALQLYGQIDLSRLDDADIRGFAEQHVDALVRARRLDAAERAAAQMLRNAPADLPAEKRATWRKLHDRLAELVCLSRQRAGDLPADGASRALALASPAIGLADQAIAELLAAPRSPRTTRTAREKTLLGDLLLNAGQADAARAAYAAAGPDAAWRLRLCDWVQGLFVGEPDMPAKATPPAAQYEAMRSRILGPAIPGSSK